MKIAVITPISHLNLNSILKEKGKVYYLENGSFTEVRNLLLEKKIDVILCNPNKQDYLIDKSLLDKTKVSVINTCSTGLNHIDIEYCKKNRIKILSLTKDFELINNLPSTSELAFSLMLCLLRKIPKSINHVSNYKWDYLPYVGNQLMDLKVGIIGYGRLGKFMVNYCKAFGAKVFIYDPYKNASNVDSLEELFSICKVISLHVHVNNETKYLIDKKVIEYSKNSPYLINTSRGEIVNEEDIVNALKDKKLGGYGTDVIEDEFGTIRKSPIIKAMNDGLNVIVTPHIGGMTFEGQMKAYKWAINKL